MYVLTSHLWICQQRTVFDNLEGIVRHFALLLAHFLVSSYNVGIRIFTYHINRLIGFIPFWVVLLFVGPKRQ